MKISREVRIASASIIILGAFIWGMNFLKGHDLFNKQRTVYAVYNQVDGLVKASPVYIRGLKVGKVTNLGFAQGSNNIVVELTLDNDILIPSQSTARIFNADILGSKAIEINFSNMSAMLENGDTLRSEMQSSISEVVNKQIEPLKNKAESMITALDSMISSIQHVFNDTMRTNVQNTFSSISNTIHSLERTTSNIDTLMGNEKRSLANIINNLDTITSSVAQNSNAISNTLQNISTLSDTITALNIAETLHRTNQALEHFAIIMKKVNNGEGSLGQLINNDSLYLNLQQSSHDLDQLLLDIKNHPGRYVHFSVFGKKTDQ